MNRDCLSSQTLVPSAMGPTSLVWPPVSKQRETGWQLCINMGAEELSRTSLSTFSMVYPLPPIAERHDWLVDEERKAYMEATVEQDIAYQIESNRRARKLTQKDLAKKIGTTQSAIARMEDPTYGRHSIPSLVKVAHAFDCAVRVTLISYSKLAEVVADTSDQALFAAPFESERHLISEQGKL